MAGRKGVEDSVRRFEGRQGRQAGQSGARAGTPDGERRSGKSSSACAKGREAQCAAGGGPCAGRDARGKREGQSRRSVGGLRAKRGSGRGEFVAAASR